MNKNTAPQRKRILSYESDTVWDLSLCAAQPVWTRWHTQDTTFTPTPVTHFTQLGEGLKLCFSLLPSLDFIYK